MSPGEKGGVRIGGGGRREKGGRGVEGVCERKCDGEIFWQIIFVSFSLPPSLPPHLRPSYFEFGTVLFINSVEHTQDGRALVTTTGERRFQIETQHVHDGYNMASVKFIVDKPVIVEEEIGMYPYALSRAHYPE